MQHDTFQHLIKAYSSEPEAGLLSHAAMGVAKALEGADDAARDKHVSSFLLLLRSMDGEDLDGEMPSTELEKDAGDDTGWQSHLKDLMHDAGHSYFGPLEKHYTKLDDEPRHDLIRDKVKLQVHLAHQKSHGNHPGKRTLMGYATTFKMDNPDIDMPTWTEMLGMSRDALKALAKKHNFMMTTRGASSNAVEHEGTKDSGKFSRRGEDVTDYADAPQLGAGKTFNARSKGSIAAMRHVIQENKKLETVQGPRETDKKKRELGTSSRHDKKTHDTPRTERGQGYRVTNEEQSATAAQGVAEGQRGAGGSAGHEDTPVMTDNKQRIQNNRQRAKLQAKREISPKVHIDSLVEAELAEITSGKLDTKMVNVVSPGGDVLVEPREPKKTLGEGEKAPRERGTSLWQQDFEDADLQGRLKKFSNLLWQRDILQRRVKAKQQRDEAVPNAMRVSRNKANRRHMQAKVMLKQDGVSATQLTQMQRAVENRKMTSAVLAVVAERVSTQVKLDDAIERAPEKRGDA